VLQFCAPRIIPESVIRTAVWRFEPHASATTTIKEDADYSGVRATFLGTLQNARVAMQADLGFADVVTPVQTDYPVILEFPAPRLAGYTRETVIAEKFEAMVKLGALNSRMKDFYDLFVLSQQFSFVGKTLSAAIAATFERRNTTISEALPSPLTAGFYSEGSRSERWGMYVRSRDIPGAPLDFTSVGQALGEFLVPPWRALASREAFLFHWTAKGPWQ